MITRNVSLNTIDTGSIILGYQGENEHTQIAINCASVFSEHADAEVSMLVKSPDGALYAQDITRDGNIVTWVIMADDTAVPGNGALQLTFVDGTEVIKSAIASTTVSPSIVWNA